MSLQVWLPLDGDLRNQGLDGSAVLSNSSATWGTGKIATKAYLTNTGTNEATFQNLIGVKEFSIAYWLKIDSSLTYNAYQDFWQVYYTNKTGTGPIRDEHNNVAGGHQLLVYKETNVGSNTNGYWGCSVSSANNVWVHIVLTKDATQTKTYCDGVLKQTQNNTVYESSTGSLTGKVRIGLATCGAYLNDFRIYDHCLSYKEVSELAKGLILHYRLSKPLPNLLRNEIHTTGAWTWENCALTANDGVLKMVSSAANCRIYNGLSNVWTSGKKYVLSFEAKSDTAGTTVDGSRSIADFTPTITLTTDWQRYSGIINCTETASGGTLSIRVNQSGKTVYFRSIKLEEGENETGYIPPETSSLYNALGYNSNIELDCAPAGNQNDGTIIGTITAVADSPRYQSSYYLLNNGSCIRCNKQLYVKDAYTLSCWVKFNSLPTNEIPIIALYRGITNGRTILNKQNSKNVFSFWVGDSTNVQINSSTQLQINKWYFVVCTKDTSNRMRIYVNGKEENTSSVITNSNTGNLSTPEIGSINVGNAGYETNYYISDVRIYCTALSSSDIAELYQTAAQVDKDGNVYAYEFKEA